MAEIRKFDPSAGNAIAAALRAAMGDPIRPATPGQPSPARPATEPEPPAATSWVTLTVAEQPED